MACLYYLAYGSNLHPVRLSERVSSARLIGTLPLSGYLLCFHKRGQDDSGKCNLLYTGLDHDVSHAALYRMDTCHKPDLDRLEGRGYQDVRIPVQHEGRSLNCFAYIARPTHIDESLMPFHWYKDLVMLGGEYLHLPDNYLSMIDGTESESDPDQTRRQTHDDLISRLRTSNPHRKPDV